MSAPVKKYLSDILKSDKKTDTKTDPNKPVDYHEIVVEFKDARNVWLNVSTPDVKNKDNFTQIQIIVKDNTNGKLITLIGAHMVKTGSILPVFNGALIHNKTLIFRAEDPISVWYESKLDD